MATAATRRMRAKNFFVSLKLPPHTNTGGTQPTASPALFLIPRNFVIFKRLSSPPSPLPLPESCKYFCHFSPAFFPAGANNAKIVSSRRVSCICRICIWYLVARIYFAAANFVVAMRKGKPKGKHFSVCACFWL